MSTVTTPAIPTYVLKGFIEIDALADNAVSEVATLGELSDMSKTYSTEKGIYVNATKPDVRLVSFFNQHLGVTTAVPVELQTHILTVAQWIYNEAKGGAITTDQADFVRNFLTEFSTVLTGVTSGDILVQGTLHIPEYMTWTYTGGAEVAKVRVWFADHSFRNQYDQYELIIIPPTANVDDLFGKAVDVQALINKRSLSELMTMIRTVSDPNPYTLVDTENYYWYDTTPGSTVNFIVPWSIIIYGAAGDNIDILKKAIADYIMSKTGHTRDEWLALMPDIFSTTEYVLAPMWHLYSVPNKVIQTGVYSPQIKYNDALTIAKKAFYGYDASHLQVYMSMTDFMYNSLGILACGSPQNRDHIYCLADKFTDYMNVPSTDGDFNRMSPLTQDWVLLMIELVKIAETMGPYTDVPIGYSRVTRNGIIYATASYRDVEYLVVSKYSMLSLMGFSSTAG